MSRRAVDICGSSRSHNREARYPQHDERISRTLALPSSCIKRWPDIHGRVCATAKAAAPCSSVHHRCCCTRWRLRLRSAKPSIKTGVARFDCSSRGGHRMQYCRYETPAKLYHCASRIANRCNQLCSPSPLANSSNATTGRCGTPRREWRKSQPSCRCCHSASSRSQ
jgi:hypothetical protein